MQVGDLVKYSHANKTFLISKIDEYGTWVQFYGTKRWYCVEDVELISASR